MRCASRSVPRRKRARLYSGKQRSERRERKRDNETRRSCVAHDIRSDVRRDGSACLERILFIFNITHNTILFYIYIYSIILYRLETSVRLSRRRSTVFRSRLPIFPTDPIFNRIRRSLMSRLCETSGRQTTKTTQSFRLSVFLRCRKLV